MHNVPSFMELLSATECLLDIRALTRYNRANIATRDQDLGSRKVCEGDVKLISSRIVQSGRGRKGTAPVGPHAFARSLSPDDVSVMIVLAFDTSCETS